MEDSNKRKQDLEDEMNRFEQEISGNLPPPPKIRNLDNNASSHSLLGPPPVPPFMSSGRNLPFPGPPPGMPPFPPGLPMPPGMPPGMPPMMVPPPMVPPMSMPMPRMQNFEKIIRHNKNVSLPPTKVDFSKAFTNEPQKNFTGESSQKKDKKKHVVRIAGGTVWEDPTLLEWDNNDFRIFVGDLGNEVSDDALLRAFSRYPSLLKAKVIRDKKTKKTKGFGFVSFKDPQDYLKAMREMNGKYVGNRPIKLRKSTWKERNINIAKKKEKEKKKLGLR